MERVSTGNPAIDRILMGGFPAHSIHIIMGAPGSGKTVLAQQLAFAQEGDRPILYLTTVSEPLAKLVTYLQEFSFADPLRIGAGILYESLAEVVAADPERLEETVAELIRRHRPVIIIIDSFKALADLVPDRARWRRILFGLTGLLTAYDATSFWIGEYGSEVISELPEFAAADGIVELFRRQAGTRDERYLRVIKLRGSSFLSGHHFFRIRPDGLEVFVRLVTPPTSDQYTPPAERVTTGVDGLDQLIQTGWLRGTATIAAGPSGAGKTALGLHFLREGVARGEPGLLVNFQENPSQMARIVAAFGWNPANLLVPGRLEHLYTSPVELHIDSIVTQIFRRIEEGRVRRVVLDSLDDMERTAPDALRYREYVYTLTQRFAAQAITSIMTLQTPSSYDWMGTTGREISEMSDNLLLLGMHFDDDLTRTIRVVKSRGTAHDGRRRRLLITPAGLDVGDLPPGSVRD
jgi:circadian clock protein KaiC